MMCCATHRVQYVSKGGGADTRRRGLGTEGSYVKIKSWARTYGKMRKCTKTIQ